MIQQGVSVGGLADSSSSGLGPLSEGSGNGMTIGKVMDWIEARLEAVKSREEEEDEDEERERSRGGTTSGSTSKPSAMSQPPAESAASTSRHKEHVIATITIF